MPVVETLKAPPVVALAELEKVRVPLLPLPTLTPEVTFSVVPAPVNVVTPPPVVATARLDADMSLPRLTVALALKETAPLLIQVMGLVAARLKPPPVTFSAPPLLNVMPEKTLRNVTLLPPTATPV